MCITGLGYCILLLRETVLSFDVSFHLGKPDTILLGRGGEGCPSVHVSSQPFHFGGGGGT